MEAMTISRVSADFGISTRMLRYYEQEGLISSFRRDDYAYRMYDEGAVVRLRQILVLRRLRIPVKQIKAILQHPDAVTAINVFRKNIGELEDEIAALSTIRDILARFIEELQKAADIKMHLLVTDESILAAITSLSPISINFKEEKTMDNLQKAEEKLSKLKDVRIVYLPSATVAAAHYIGEAPEEQVTRLIEDFVRKTSLCTSMPCTRQYGFNHPNPDETGCYGYEMWVTIPEDMEVPLPLEKKHFPGGMYAAHMIPFGSFNEWEWLHDWIMKNEKYLFAGDPRDAGQMMGCLEEHLNFVGQHTGLDRIQPEQMQLDLLIPVRLKNNAN